MTLTHNQRQRILNVIRKRVLRNHFNVSGVNYYDWLRSLERLSPELLAVDVQASEAGIQDILHELRSSHTGLFHGRPNRLLPQHTINATFGKVLQDSKPLWFILDAFEEGPAQRAGLRSGDVLHRVDGVEYTAPNMPPFRTGRTHVLSVSAPDGTADREVSIEVPSRKGNKNLPPILPPKSISRSMIAPGVGLLRITWFPGAMGVSFAKSLDASIADLKRQGCDRLMIDLRGNIGGGLAFARLASYLCPDRVPIGYSLTPKRQRGGYELEEFKRVVYPKTRLINEEVDFCFAFSRTMEMPFAPR